MLLSEHPILRRTPVFYTAEEVALVMAENIHKYVGHNIRNAYIPIRDDDLTVDESGRVCYNHQKDGEIEEYNRNSYNATVGNIRGLGIDRLTKNYEIFRTPQDRYMVNAMLAVYFSFLGEDEKAKEYKAIVDGLPASKIAKDEKIERLIKRL